jgi:putative hydrolase of the HAD superfamily
MPACVFFDAGFTLIHPFPGVGAIYAEHGRAAGIEMDAARAEKAFRTAWRHQRTVALAQGRIPYGRNEADARRFWYAVIREVLASMSLHPPTEERFYADLFEHFGSARCWRGYDDVLPALTGLRDRGIGAGIMSNWDGRLRTILDGLGMSPLLDHIVLSCDIGAEKPAPAIFAYAARLAREKHGPDVVLGLVGDEPMADGYGALRAGWRQCLLRRSATGDASGDLRSASRLQDAIQAIVGPA